MRSLVSALSAVALLALAGCPGDNTISCTVAGDCLQGGIPGVCLPSPTSSKSWCGFNDATCPGGLRWGVASGDGLAGMCVATVDAGTPDAGPDSGPDADLTDAGPEPDAAILSTRAFVADGKESIYVYDLATMEALGTTTVPPATYFNGSFSVAHGSAYLTRFSQAGTDVQIVAMDPATGIIRNGYPRVVPVGGLVGEAGYYSRDGSTMKLRALQDFSTILRTYTASATVTNFDIVPDGTVLVVVDKVVHQLDAQLTEIGTPITNIMAPVTMSSSTVLNRIVLADLHCVDLYDLSTHTHVGSRRCFTDFVNGVAFDNEKLVIVLNGGMVTAISVDNATSEVIPPVMRAGTHFRKAVFDPTRNRIICSDDSNLVVLDAATLQHVSGSPVALPKPAQTIRVF